MKTRFLLACAMALAYVPLANAYSDDNARKALQPTINEIIANHNNNVTHIESCINRLNNLEKRVGDLSEKLAELDKLLKEERSAVAKGNPTDGGSGNGSYSFWLLLPIVIVILVFLCIVFWPRRKALPPAPVDSSSSPKCPLCGWEHDPGDTVCKNPNCRTQF